VAWPRAGGDPPRGGGVEGGGGGGKGEGDGTGGGGGGIVHNSVSCTVKKIFHQWKVGKERWLRN